MKTVHQPVMQKECLEALFGNNREDLARIKDQSIIIDCTLGGGGHSEAILKKNQNVFLIAFDKDKSAIERGSQRLEQFSERCLIVNSGFEELGEYYQSFATQHRFGNWPVLGMLADLGLSSDQLEKSGRGFSFSNDEPLDMRFDQNKTLTAEQVLNSYSERELLSVFRRGGLRVGAKALVREIHRNRPLATTFDFRRVCERVIKRFDGASKSNVATVPFQALRIEVNQEYEALGSLLSQALDILRPSGRLAIICFQSLEDKLVGSKFREWARGEQISRWDSSAPLGRLVYRKALRPTLTEVEANPRARSARLWVFEKADVNVH